MLPARRFNGQLGFTDFFNDFFENRSLERLGNSTPAINVIESDTKYKIEVAAPGMLNFLIMLRLATQTLLILR